MSNIKQLLNLADNLILQYPGEEGRIIASKWITKIQSSGGDEEDEENEESGIRDHFLRLLLLALERKKLVPPFDAPPPDDELSTIENLIQPFDLSQNILEDEFLKIGNPPYSVEVSSTLNEYCAYQEIPGFGSHFYYAFSPEKITNWTNMNNSKLPKTSFDVKSVPVPDSSVYADIMKEMAKKPYERKPEEQYNRRCTEKSLLQKTGAIKSQYKSNNPNIRTDFLENTVQFQISQPRDFLPDNHLNENVDIMQLSRRAFYGPGGENCPGRRQKGGGHHVSFSSMSEDGEPPKRPPSEKHRIIGGGLDDDNPPERPNRDFQKEYLAKRQSRLMKRTSSTQILRCRLEKLRNRANDMISPDRVAPKSFAEGLRMTGTNQSESDLDAQNAIGGTKTSSANSSGGETDFDELFGNKLFRDNPQYFTKLFGQNLSRSARNRSQIHRSIEQVQRGSSSQHGFLNDAGNHLDAMKRSPTLRESVKRPQPVQERIQQNERSVRFQQCPDVVAKGKLNKRYSPSSEVKSQPPPNRREIHFS